MFDKIDECFGLQVAKIVYQYKIAFNIEYMLVRDRLSDAMISILLDSGHELLSVLLMSSVLNHEGARWLVLEPGSNGKGALVNHLVSELHHVTEEAGHPMHSRCDRLLKTMEGAITEAEEVEERYTSGPFSSLS